MERIGKGGSGIRGNVSGVSYSSDTHPPKGSDDLFTGIAYLRDFPVRVGSLFLCGKPVFKNPVEEKRDKTGQEMGADPVIPLKEDGPGFEFALHDPEGFFNLPAAFVYPDDLIDICFQVCADRVEAVKTGFGLNRLLV